MDITTQFRYWEWSYILWIKSTIFVKILVIMDTTQFGHLRQSYLLWTKSTLYEKYMNYEHYNSFWKIFLIIENIYKLWTILLNLDMYNSLTHYGQFVLKNIINYGQYC